MPDKGHENLIADLEALLNRAKNYDFHDFKSKTEAGPRLALHKELQRMIRKNSDGPYDNEPDEDDKRELAGFLKKM